MLTRDEHHVVSILESIGISATKLPENSDRTPDLRACDTTHRYIIEVKTRTDDATLARELRERGTAYRRSTLGPTKAVTGIFQHAISQIDAYASDELRVVWMCVESRRGAEYMLAEQVRQTLYGSTLIVGGTLGNKAVECYFFHESIFYRYQQLDCVVIAFGHRLALCLNPYSARLESLRQCRLVHSFSRNVLDVARREQEQRCFVADCAIDRNDRAAVLAYVCNKYCITGAIHLNFDEHASFAAIDTADAEGDAIDIDPYLVEE